MTASTTPPDPAAGPAARRNWTPVGVWVLLIVAMQLVLGPHVRLHEWSVPVDTSPAWLEARAWLAGRTDLPGWGYDLALVDGKHYNTVPPLFTFLSLGSLLMQRVTDGPAADTAGFYPPYLIMLVVFPLPIVGLWALGRTLAHRDGDESNGAADAATWGWAGFLTFAWLASTSMSLTLAVCRDGNINYVNHALSQTGLFLIAGDVFGRRRWWPAAAGLVIAIWTRQFTIVFALPLMWLALCEPRPVRWRAAVRVAGATLVGVTGIMAVNYARFGDPLDSGYQYIYDKRQAPTDLISKRAHEYGVFSWRCIPFNLWYMNLELAPWEWSAAGPRPYARGPNDRWGASMWFATPLLLLVLADARRWWRDPRRRAMMLGSFAVLGGLMFYHTTGAAQFGHWRYSLDVLPIWLAVIAPLTMATPARRWLALLCTAWSAWYFSLLM